MGAYTTKTLTQEQFSEILETVKSGYSHNGKDHKPNNKLAVILTLQANLGMRIGDILHLRLSHIIKDGNHYRLDVTEEKTGKKRAYIVPEEVYSFVENYCLENKISPYRRIFELTERAVQKSIKEVTAFLGMPEISTHSFRKFAACRIYETSGFDIEVTREFLQHSDVGITQRYIKRTRPQLEAAILSSVCLG